MFLLLRFRVTPAAAGALVALLQISTGQATTTGPPGTLLFNSLVNTAVPAGGTIGGQPAVDTFSRNKQNEPTIALDPLTGALIAGSNDEIDEPLCSGAGTSASPGSCPFAPNVGISGIYSSTSGGASWIQPSFKESAVGVGDCRGRTIHTLPGYCEQGLESFGDPTLAVGPALGPNGFTFANGSVVYYGNLAFPNTAPTQPLPAVPVVAVSRSHNDGQSWLAPVVATSADNPVDFNDKDFVWADANPKSPFFGNVYLSWTLFQGNGHKGFTPEPIVIARSTDGGQTWSRVNRLTSSHNNNSVGGRQGSLIRTGADGTVYVFWEGAIDHHSEIQVAVSHDGGETFGQPRPVQPVVDIPSPLPGSSFRTDSFPSADVNQVTGEIDVTWADYATGTALIEFTQSNDGGVTWSTPITIGGRQRAFNAFFPSVAISPDGTHVFVGWPAQTVPPVGTAPGPGAVTQLAAYNLRTMGNWSGAHLLSTAFGDPDGSSTNSLGAQFLGDYATAVASNSAGWFVWTDTRNEASCAAVDAFRAGTAGKPNPDLQCPAVNGKSFGNSDIFVGAVGF